MTKASVQALFRGCPSVTLVLTRAMCEKQTKLGVFMYRLKLLGREKLRVVGVDPSGHPSRGAHEVPLGHVARHDGPDVSGAPG
jgi:hypothetical protein